jgi:hypothetical protein
MSDTGKRHLILAVGERATVPSTLIVGARVVALTEATAREALEEIFAADTVAVWSDVRPKAGEGK